VQHDAVSGYIMYEYYIFVQVMPRYSACITYIHARTMENVRCVFTVGIHLHIIMCLLYHIISFCAW
jgi:hypothetical protein